VSPHPARPERVPVDVCALEDLGEEVVTEVAVGRRRVGAVRVGERVFFFGERCPHQGGPLSRGQLTYPTYAAVPGDMAVDRGRPAVSCPWHGWEFDLDTGRALVDPRVRVKLFDSTVVDGRVCVYLPEGT
jgi:nitrite reductase/ring-hydroxylating ferredoxin subunit